MCMISQRAIFDRILLSAASPCRIVLRIRKSWMKSCLFWGQGAGGRRGAVGGDWVGRLCRGQRCTLSVERGTQTGKDGRVEQEGLWKGTAYKPWPALWGPGKFWPKWHIWWDCRNHNKQRSTRCQWIHCGHLQRLNFDIYIPFLGCFGESFHRQSRQC